MTSTVVALCGPARAGSVTLAWDPNSESDLAGYVVSWGTQPGAYTSSQDVANVVTFAVPNLTAGQRYYFAVQAYNTSGLTSPYSAEVSALIPGSSAPALTAASPASGIFKGGTAVTLTGAGFTSGATVSFGGVLASAVSVLNPSTITAVTPGHAAGAVDVLVTVSGGTSAKLAKGFTYVKKIVNAKGLQPISGNEAGGTLAKVSGDGFDADTVVTFDGVQASSVVSVSSTTMVVTAPPHPYGTVDVVVTDASGLERTAPQPYTYVRDDGNADLDGDGLPDAWESTYGLDPADAAGDNGAAGDPDQDGATNLEEYTAGTHPLGLCRRYFAEGVSSVFFTTVFAVANPADVPVSVVLQFFKDNGERATHPMRLAPRSRATFDARSLPAIADAAFSTTIESTELVVADRTVTWDSTGYGGHAETAIEAPATRWYLAEGATHSGFDLFYLLQNPGAEAAHVQVRYLLPTGAPVVKHYTVPPLSRYNIWVDLEDRRLADADVSAEVSSQVPVIVERSMYSNSGNQPFGAGHNSAGIASASTSWFLAEGATGDYFDMFILIANPTSTAAQVKASYLLPSGSTVEKAYEVAPNSRYNIWVDLEDERLANTAVSTTIESTNQVPLIVERTMWWPGFGMGGWQEAHNAPGTTATATRWALADGELGGSQRRSTYILVANTSAHAGDVKVTLLLEDGTNLSRTFPVPARSRFNVDVAAAFPEAAGKRFGSLVESLGDDPVQTVVERAMYWDAGGVVWAAGTDAVGTALRESLPSASVSTPQN